MRKGIKDTLVFNLKDLRHEDFKVYKALVPPRSLDLTFEDAKFIRPVSCTIDLLRQGGDNVYVTADIVSVISVECRRCLNLFETGITTTLEVLFCHSNESQESALDPVAGEERYYDGDTFDLSEDVRQVLVLEIPTWSLCSEACEGLCPQCGTELNEEKCLCERTDKSQPPVSNPFSVLFGSRASEIAPTETFDMRRGEVRKQDRSEHTR